MEDVSAESALADSTPGRDNRGLKGRVNNDEEPTPNATWITLKMITAAILLTLILVFVIDVRGGH
jgi:hypothetical protein